jgi:hypothetical protein
VGKLVIEIAKIAIIAIIAVIDSDASC